MPDDVAHRRPDRLMLGVTLMVSAVFMMSVQEALFKYFSNDLSLWQIFTLRGILAMPLLIGFAFFRRQQRGFWGHVFGKWSMLRSIYMTLMFIAMYSALPFLSLSTVAAGIYTAPVFVTLLSAWVLRESVGLRGWVAIAMGFAGVLVILQPGADAFTYLALLPVLGGFLYALSNVTTRSKCHAVPVVALAMSLNIALLLAGVLLSIAVFLFQPAGDFIDAYPFLASGWSSLEIGEWAVIFLLSFLVVAVGMTLAGAYQSAPPSTVATFDYSYLIFMALWDTLFFATPPTLPTLIGMLLIVTAGLLAVGRR